MTSMIQEFVDSRGIALRIDRRQGILHGVKILGGQSRNRRSYPPATLEKAAPLYENARVYVNHGEGDVSRPRRYQDRIGSIRNVTYRRGEGLYADLHFNPRHAVAEQLFWDAEHAPEHVGFSHHVEAEVVREDKGSVVRRILAVRSVDLVSDPATTRGLFEAGGSESPPAVELAALTEEDLRRHRADLIESVRADGEVERKRLREQVATLEESLVEKQRQLGVYRLIHQYRVPSDRSGEDGAQVPLWSESFLDVLLNTSSEKVARKLIEDRIALCEGMRKDLQSEKGTRQNPVCREQHPSRPVEVRGREDFLARIT